MLTYTIQLNANGSIMWKHEVAAREGWLVGDYWGGKAYQPDNLAVQEAIPSKYYKAFMRSLIWWQEQSMSGRFMPLKMDLTTLSGKPMGTLYATPNWEPKSS